MKQRFCNLCREWKDLKEFKGRTKGQTKCNICWDKWDTERQKRNSKRTDHIYILIDPFTNELRYVGRTYDPNLRLGAHISCAKNVPFNNRRKAQWVNDIVKQGKMPIVKVLETMPYNTTGKERELFYIDLYKRNGSDLLNAPAA